MSLQLCNLDGCFEGAVPAKIATCSKEGVPNASYLSHVYKVDDHHVATSFQFFNKTRANLLENPYAMIQVRSPANLQPYKLKVKFLRSESEGPVFNEMSIKLDVIAAYEGVGSVFKLRAADIYEVLSIEKILDRTSFEPKPQHELNLHDLELARVMSDKMNEAQELDALLDLSMSLLHRYLGWEHMILLLADEKEGTLLTHASFGYEKGGVGSEVKWGEGLIGICAEHRRLFQASSLQEGFRYAKAVKDSQKNGAEQAKIPLPGLIHPASQIAAPVCANGEFLGVLAVESGTQAYWTERDTMFLSLMANLLGLGINSLAGKDTSIQRSTANPDQASSWNFRFSEDGEMVFVNDHYLIKNIPARILHFLLDTHLKTGRLEFSNMELRAEKRLKLPDYKDNLETRLILLRRRLQEQKCGVQLVSTGRGKFRLEISGRICL